MNYDDNYPLMPLLDWLQKLILSNKEVNEIVDRNPLLDGKFQLYESNPYWEEVMKDYSKRYCPQDVDIEKDYPTKVILSGNLPMHSPWSHIMPFFEISKGRILSKIRERSDYGLIVFSQLLS